MLYSIRVRKARVYTIKVFLVKIRQRKLVKVSLDKVACLHHQSYLSDLYKKSMENA